jgi:hypothetical protein
MARTARRERVGHLRDRYAEELEAIDDGQAVNGEQYRQCQEWAEDAVAADDAWAAQQR